MSYFIITITNTAIFEHQWNIYNSITHPSHKEKDIITFLKYFADVNYALTNDDIYFIDLTLCVSSVSSYHYI